jgi:hypothetical protein
MTISPERIAETVLHRGSRGTSRVCVDRHTTGSGVCFRVYDTCDEDLTVPGASWDERVATLESAVNSMMVCVHSVLYWDSLGGEGVSN